MTTRDEILKQVRIWASCHEFRTLPKKDPQSWRLTLLLTSIMDQPPQSSRSSISDPPSVAQGPLPLFDTQLRFVTESYLSFFQERQVFSLHIHSKTKS
jgi:hypothetical protein